MDEESDNFNLQIGKNCCRSPFFGSLNELSKAVTQVMELLQSGLIQRFGSESGIFLVVV